ncbi:MAG: transcriptional regulator [Crocinitomicaceae bacterium TMED16]|nr:MAG: transcriptional regulator [Crocinitomicaceae bacterium TMED16]
MGIIRKTESVEILLNEFQDTETALSTVELITRLGKFMNKTTIYRILEKLEDDGILHSFIGFDGVKRFARCKSCSKSNHSDVHPHFQCISCGKSECLDIEVNIPDMSNREVLFSQLLIKGKCDLCMV